MKIRNRALIHAFLILAFMNSYSQDADIQKERDRILEEGLYLYRLEKASWHASDILFKDYKNVISEVKGYLSMVDKKTTRTIFWNDQLEIVFTVQFDSMASEKTGVPSSFRRPAMQEEADIIQLRIAAFNKMIENKGKFFSFYEKTRPNLIPVIRNGERIVYVLTASNEKKLLIGNDYKLYFNEKNEINDKTKLHKSLITLDMSDSEKETTGSMHSHVLKDQPFITPTDVCTFMLYKDVFKVSTHTVISEKWMSLFDSDKVNLTIITSDLLKK